MTQKKAELLLAAVIIARSTSYLLMKIGLHSMGPFTMLGTRFLLAFLVLLLLFGRRLRHIDKTAICYGALLGGSFFIVMTAQTFALKSVDSSMVSFIESTAVVMVPLLNAAINKKAPSLRCIACSLLCVAGVGLLTYRKGVFTLSLGVWLTLCSAFFYAVSIILTDSLARREDPFILGVLQVGFLGVFNLAASFLFEVPRIPNSISEWGIILALALVCSAFGFTLQPVAQRYTTAERAGQFCALTPLSAAILGCLFLQERFSLGGIAGAALILCSMLLRQ